MGLVQLLHAGALVLHFPCVRFGEHLYDTSLAGVATVYSLP